MIKCNQYHVTYTTTHTAPSGGTYTVDHSVPFAYAVSPEAAIRGYAGETNARNIRVSFVRSVEVAEGVKVAS